MPIFLELTVPVFARMHWALFCLGPDTLFSVLSLLTPVTLGELPLASWESFALGGGPDWFRQSILQKATHSGDTIPRGRVNVPAPDSASVSYLESGSTFSSRPRKLKAARGLPVLGRDSPVESSSYWWKDAENRGQVVLLGERPCP